MKAAISNRKPLKFPLPYPKKGYKYTLTRELYSFGTISDSGIFQLFCFYV